MFETGQLTSWSFHQGSEGFLAFHDWDYWRNIFPGNWDTFGVALSFYLVQGLDLNLVIPIGQWWDWPRHQTSAITRDDNGIRMYEIYPGSLQLTAGYNIPDVGKVAFAFIGSGQDFSEGDGFKVSNYGKIHLSFYSNSLVEGLAFQVGFATDLLKDVTAPISIGAAVHFNSGDFGVKFRLGVDIGQDAAAPYGGGFVGSWYLRDLGEDMFLTANVMPSYNTPAGKICLDIGLSLYSPKDGDAANGFWLNPYLKKGLNGGYFQVGLLVYNNIGGSGSPQRVMYANDDDRVKTQLQMPLLLGFNF
jgi:hypothetical protein